MPDWSFYDWSGDQNPGWADLQYILQAAANDSIWHTRLPKLFFRGSNDTGGYSTCDLLHYDCLCSSLVLSTITGLDCCQA